MARGSRRGPYIPRYWKGYKRPQRPNNDLSIGPPLACLATGEELVQRNKATENIMEFMRSRGR